VSGPCGSYSELLIDLRKLTHGIIHKVTSSGRVADTWLGASAAITKKLKESGHNLINRDGL
jgi:hypothetical protein